MASDAKIGLLLGLVFIFIIALVINGLPSFQEDEGSNELTAKMVNGQNNPQAIAAKERVAISRRVPAEVTYQRPVSPAPSAVNQNVSSETAAQQNIPEVVIKESLIERAIASAAKAVAAKSETPKAESNEAAASKTCVVGKGDTLADIAKRFYGAEEGNKKANIVRIFEANRKLLKSPDELRIGQKLIIPPVQVASTQEKGKVVDVLSGTNFTKVESIGKRHLIPAGGRKTEQAEQTGWYVVREGDSLWRIAAEKLGNGSRYGEIAKLNAGILDGEDSLTVGMRLRMPSR
ncbi:MAG: LysM peptidoglycan-binding domain-containing protein [Sedimentisphaerales bacterium]|nr:LysM peptidoglycan-binding domain-containing protein [Sedimentisphaerales bacterium]